MSGSTLNDIKYSFKPLEVFVTSKDYKVDEVELKKSVEKSKEIFAKFKANKENNS